MKILADASLPGLEAAFPLPFTLNFYSNSEELENQLKNNDVLLCRSTLKVNSDLIKNCNLKFVATASSGSDHIDHVFLKSKNIQVIDAKGSNASSVADYVVASLAYLEENNLIKGNKAGIIGLGKVGTKVYSRLSAADYQISLYDPLKALHETQFESCKKEKLYDTDLLCIHAELHSAPPFPSLNLINKAFLSSLKPGCVIINAARGGIINESELVSLNNKLIYCTDVYHNEPAINKKVINNATLCTPHIAGHSVEAKLAAVTMISKQLHQLLKLPVPIFNKTLLPPQTIQDAKEKSWQKTILSLYNPFIETNQLKQALDKEKAFLTLRKNHQQRHDFTLFSDLSENPKTRLLMGF